MGCRVVVFRNFALASVALFLALLALPSSLPKSQARPPSRTFGGLIPGD